MTPAAFLDLACSTGAEITVVGGKLATRGLPTELRADVLQHKGALLVLLQRPPEPTAAELRVIAAVEQCEDGGRFRSRRCAGPLVAQSHPLTSTPVREFLDRLEGITAEQEEVIRRIAEGTVAAGLIQEGSVDLRCPPQ